MMHVIKAFIFIVLAACMSFSCAGNLDRKAKPAQDSFNYPSPPAEGEKEYFPVASEGQARCVVVEPTNAPPAIHHAAEALRAYLQRVTGAPIRLMPENAPDTNALAKIHVGDTAVGKNVPLDLPELRYGKDLFPNLNGYMVKTVDRETLVIRGLTEKGVAHGVVGFLKRYAGIRQYWECAPGGLGEVAPNQPTLYIPQVEWRDWPFFYSRSISQRAFTRSRGPLDFYRRNNTLPCSENYADLMRPSLYAKDHPEYFSLSGGKRIQPTTDDSSGWQPCVSNPDVARIMAESVCEYFRKNPQAVALNVSINDGGRDCECEKCQAMDGSDANYRRRMSDRYVKFTNKICELVERKFPSKLIVFLAYGGAAYAPASVKPHRMILPVITVSGRNALQAWDEWRAAGPEHMGFYFHHDDTLFFIFPKLDLHQQARRIRYAVDSGRAMAVYMESYPHWPLSGLVSYITAELLWDPRQDEDALLDKFYADFFGPAAAPMKTFYSTLEAGYEEWLAKNGLPYPAGSDISSTAESRSFNQFSVLSVEGSRRAAEALREAEKLSAGDTLASRRVEAVRRLFALVEKCVEVYWISEGLAGKGAESEKDALQNIEAARRIYALGHEMGEYITNSLDKTPPDLYGAVFSQKDNMRPIEMYEALKTGEPWPEAVGAVKSGTDAISAWLKKSHNKEEALHWWDVVIANETRPELKSIFQMARLASGAGELKPLYRSDFNALGKMLALPDLDLQPGDQEIVIDQQKEEGHQGGSLGGGVLTNAGFGIHAWFPDRTRFTLSLTRKDVPGGNYALVVKNIQRARLGGHAAIPAGARQFRAGFLFKRNSEKGIYTAEVMCNVGTRQDRKQVSIAKLAIPAQADKWHEVAANVEVPENALTIFLHINVNNQAPEAKCWVADAFISQYMQ